GLRAGRAEQPVPGQAAAHVAPRRVAAQLQAAQAGGPRHLGQVRPADRVVAPGAGAVTAFTPAEFMAAAAKPLNGNTAWASRYAAELRRIVVGHASRAPRSVQKHLGPSEIGHVCHRQVAGELAGVPATNHVTDPWASIMGTAGHAWMEACLNAYNERVGRVRFLTEFKVRPTMGFEGNPGTGDGYDADERAVIDHKFLGRTSMDKLRRSGPPRH